MPPECSFELTLEQKVGQLLVAHFRGAHFNEQAQELLKTAYVGGIIYYTWSNELSSPQQVHALSRELQQQSAQLGLPPLFLCVDQEGGLVCRLQKGYTPFPGARALACTDPATAELCAYYSAKEMRASGVNFNLAPVVDVDSQPHNPVIGLRAYSSDPEKVALFGRAALQGYQRGGVLACLKHFPGHGDTLVDSHRSLPLVSKSLKELWTCELVPFAKLSASAPAIMTAHIVASQIDQRCATLSPIWLQEVLRRQLHYEGLIVSDSLVMEGVLQQCPSLAEAALQAIEAGCDLILLGGRALQGQKREELTPAGVAAIHRHLVQAAKEGRLSSARLESALARILASKAQLGLFCERLPPSFDENSFCTTPSMTLAQAVAQKSVSLAFGTPLSLPSSLVVAAPAALKGQVLQALEKRWALLTSPPSVEFLWWPSAEPTSQWLEQNKALASKPLLLFSYSAQRYPQQRALARLFLKQRYPVVVVCSQEDEALLFQEEGALAGATTLGPSPFALERALELLGM